MARRGAERAVNPFRGEARPADAISAPDGEAEAPVLPRGQVPAPELPLREMSGFEEEYVEREAAGENTARLVNGVLARCLVAPGADGTAALDRVHALTVADRDAALVRLRRLSLGDAIDTEVDCPSCGAVNAASFNLALLPLEVARPVAQFAVALPDGRQALLRQFSAGDQEAMFDAGLEGAAARLSWLIGRLLLRLGATEGPFDIATAQALPVAARAASESALASELPDLDLSMGLTCHACGHGFSAPFDVAGFFLPR
jgi:hypothetical protein